MDESRVKAVGYATKEGMNGQIRTERVCLLTILAVATLAYLPSLSHSFQYDDLNHILGNKQIADPLGYFRAFAEKGYSEWTTRLVPNLTLCWNYFLFGFNPTGYHATNLAIHLLNIALIWRFARVLLDRFGNKDSLVPLAAAAFFALHPLNTEAVVYCNARPNTVCTALYLMTMLALIEAVETRNRGRELIARWCLFGVLLILTLLTKELAVTIVVTAPLLLLWLGSGPSAPYREIRSRVVWLMVGLFVIGMVAIAATGAWSYVALSSAYTSGWGLGSYFLLNAAGQSAVFFKYLGLACAPFPSFLNVDHDVRPLCQTLNPGNGIGAGGQIELIIVPIVCLLGVLGLIAGALALRNRAPLVSYLMLWPMLTHAPTSLVPRGEQMVEYRTYLPMVGISLLFALAGGRLLNGLSFLPAGWINIRAVAVSAMTGLFLWGAVERAAVWETPESLWTDTIGKSPRKARPYLNLGYAQETSGQLEAAIATYTRGLAQVPENSKLHYNRGNARAALGDPGGAVEDLTRALQLEPNFADACNNRGKARLALGDWEAAIEDYTRALASDRNHALAYSNRAAARGMNGDVKGALADADAALNANPKLAEAHLNRGNVRATTGDIRGALRDFRDALALNPGLTDADLNRGLVQARQGDLARSTTDLERTAQGPQSASAPFANPVSISHSIGSPALASGVKVLGTALSQSERLAQAVDATNVVWRTGGSAPWFDYTRWIPTGMEPSPDFDAACSGQISHNEESWLEADIPVPGTLVFSWGVSSQPNADALRFFSGDKLVASISGYLWWQRRAFDVPAGTVRWVYSTDAAERNGSNRGYVNMVSFYPSVENSPPTIVQEPVPSSFPWVMIANQEVGEDAVFAVGATGEAPLRYQWYKGGAPLAGAVQPTLVLREVNLADAGSYHVIVTNRLGSVTSTAVTLTISTFGLANALDTPPQDPSGGLFWATGGNRSWVALTMDPTAHDKQDSAVSGLISHNQESWIERTVTGPMIVSFWWKVSSEKDADFLQFQVGDVAFTKISGDVNWREETFELPAGPHRLRWRYAKNGAVSAGEDRGWLDQVTLRLPPQQLLALALDATNLVWRTGVNASWMDFTLGPPAEIVPLDGWDAARSGAIADDHRSWLETDLSAPGTIAFWWSVSSQTNADLLRFFIGGTEIAAISGDAKWQQRIFSVPAGSQIARWEYSKDGSRSEGLDRGILDQVTFAPLRDGEPPTTIYSPQPQTAFEGSDVSFAVIAVGAGPLTYQWYKNAAPITGATEASLELRRVTLNQAGAYQAVVRNPYGAVTNAVAYLSVQPSPFSFALETTGLVWSTGGNASWFAFSSSPGAIRNNSAGSGTITQNQTSWIETSVTGPLLLQFRWRVSSEPNVDYLRFILGGVELAHLSGEVAWRQEAFVVPAGPQTLRWEYNEKSSMTGGAHRGWLDNVVISSGAPAITSPPQDQAVVAGENVIFSVSASGFPPLTYQWLKDGTAIPGATNSILRLGKAPTVDASQYSVAVSNSLGSVATSGATWTLTSLISLAEALDRTDLVWSAGGNSSWLGEPRGAFPAAWDGIDAAKSGFITDGQESWIQTTVTGPKILRFRWKVSSQENADFLRLFVGKTEAAHISGEIDWRREDFTIPEGEQSVRWQYSKDASGSAGLDRAWLDHIEIFAAPQIIQAPASQVVWEGSSVTFAVSVDWEPELTYLWLKDGRVIPGQTTHLLVLRNVSATDAGNYAAVVSNGGGSTTSGPATLEVHPPPEPFLRILAGPPLPAVSIKTMVGQRFVLEASDSLNPAEWRAVDSVVGEGTVKTFRDSTPAASRRFYRVRIE